jgi:hypothetical protein
VSQAVPIDVFLIGGQSNATGQGYMANLPRSFKADTNVLLFHSGIPHLDSGADPLKWLPLHQASESPDRFGPELGFGNRMQELCPQRSIAIIKHAHSGTNLYEQWEPGAAQNDRRDWGPHFAVFVETVEAGLSGLREKGFQPVIRGMLWQQGESDADRTLDIARNYGRNLSHLISRIRQQFNSPDTLFVYGYVLPPPNKGEGRDLIRLAQRDIDQDSGSSLAVEGAFVVETDDLDHRADDADTRYPLDHLHFGTKGTLELGCRMAEKMRAVAALL